MNIPPPLQTYIKVAVPSWVDDWLNKREEDVERKTYYRLAKKSIADHIVRAFERVSFVRNSVLQAPQIYLKDVWVAPRLKIHETKFADYSSKIFVKSPGLTILFGSACLGKTTTLHKIFLDCYEASTPAILIEFRRMSDSGYSVMEYLSELLVQDTTKPYRVIEVLGILRPVILLDGFDEVPEDKRSEVVQDIERILEKQPWLTIVMTSRPWVSRLYLRGRSLEIQPYSLKKINQLVKKLLQDENIANAAIASLRTGLYAKFNKIFSNPLFVMIYLRAVQRGGIHAAALSYQKSSFYRDICLNLFREHDLNKEFTLVRQYSSGLAEQDLFNLHKYISVMQKGGTMPAVQMAEFQELVKRAGKALKLEADPRKVAEDIITGVGIIVEDSSICEWMHRSFQEYFIARYVLEDNESPYIPVILANQQDSESLTLVFLDEISRRTTLMLFDTPILERLRDSLERFLALNTKDLLNICVESVSCQGATLCNPAFRGVNPIRSVGPLVWRGSGESKKLFSSFQLLAFLLARLEPGRQDLNELRYHLDNSGLNHLRRQKEICERGWDFFVEEVARQLDDNPRGYLSSLYLHRLMKSANDDYTKLCSSIEMADKFLFEGD